MVCAAVAKFSHDRKRISDVDLAQLREKISGGQCRLRMMGHTRLPASTALQLPRAQDPGSRREQVR